MRRPVLWLALVCHLLLATGYALRTPAFEGPDENGHAYYAAFLANRKSLPIIQSSADAELLHGRDESPMGHHPPLYYSVLALTMVAGGHADTVPTWSLGSGGALQWRHGYDELPPISSGIVLLRILRGWSVVFGLLTIVLTWRLGQIAFPGRPAVADGAALLLACLPQFSFMHGVLNCDNLAATLSHAALVVLTAGLCSGRLSLRTGAGLGLLTGLALLTKLTCLFLVPLLGATYLLALWRWPDRRRQTLASGAVMSVIALLVSGWFFLRNLELYGEVLAQTRIEAITAHQLVPAGRTWEYLTRFFLPELGRSFVGYFGWWRLPAPGWLLAVCGALGVLATAGWIVGRRRGFRVTPAVWVLMSAVVLLYGSILRLNLHIASPQGRYLFPTAGPIMVLVTAGLVLLGERLAPGLPPWFRWVLRSIPPVIGFAILQLHFTPAFQIPPPDDPYHASMITGITSPPGEGHDAVELLEPGNGAALHSPPTFRWVAVDDAPYGLHLYDSTGEIWISTEQHGLRLREGSWTLPAEVWTDLRSDRELSWKVRRLPDRARGESENGVAESSPFSFTLVR